MRNGFSLNNYTLNRSFTALNVKIPPKYQMNYEKENGSEKFSGYTNYSCLYYWLIVYSLFQNRVSDSIP